VIHRKVASQLDDEWLCYCHEYCTVLDNWISRCYPYLNFSSHLTPKFDINGLQSVHLYSTVMQLVAGEERALVCAGLQVYQCVWLFASA